MCSSPSSRSRSGSVAVMPGGRFGAVSTVTSKLWNVSRPDGSVAVTVIVAVPRVSASTATLCPEAVAVATSGFEEPAANVRGSSSGSLKYGDTSTDRLTPGASSRSGIRPTVTGPPPGTVTSNSSVASSPSGSEAVTAIVVEPRASASTVTWLPAASATATAGFDDAAR